MLGEIVMGSLTTPASKRLTLATSAAWAAAERFLWMIPPHLLGHGNGQSRLGDGVHGRRDSGIFRWMRRVSLCSERGVARKDVGEGRNQQDVVKR